MIALLLAIAAPTAVDAEHAFAREAQTKGQWTAFRAWARADALMFTPQPVNVHEFLKDRKDPPAAMMWWPGKSFVSCDGKTAINLGPWLRDGGKFGGYFTTVWHREGDNWRWSYDGGDSLDKPMAANERPIVRRAACQARPHNFVESGSMATDGGRSGEGRSSDGTLAWSWTVSAKGERHFLAKIWNGRRFDTVLDQHVAAPE